MTRADYSKLTDEVFDGILEELVADMSAGEILLVPGAYEVFSEHLNNEVLARWEERHPELAFPDDEED